ncbi:MAG TPA: chorismate mutase, partial [Symbiobacteriaceae bacterium]|nr:chorismate mutase [Symbiobacteriaceae bacterium]
FETYTRNTLDLGIAVAARNISGFPVIIDPSHAAGRRDLIPALSEAALAAGADGLMIEVHPCPEKALSDADQQLTFEAFRSLMSRLDLLPVEAIETMEGCRSEIDRIDDEILALLARRMQTARQIGVLKEQSGMPTIQPERERAILERLAAVAEPDLGPGGVRAVWEAIIGCSRRAQDRAS